MPDTDQTATIFFSCLGHGCRPSPRTVHSLSHRLTEAVGDQVDQLVAERELEEANHA
jgi:hypothetical protein